MTNATLSIMLRGKAKTSGRRLTDARRYPKKIYADELMKKPNNGIAEFGILN